MPRLNEIDSDVLHKAMQYSKNAYEEAMEAKEAAIRTEIAIKEFIKDFNTSEETISNVDCNDKTVKGAGRYTKKKGIWYTVSVVFLV